MKGIAPNSARAPFIRNAFEPYATGYHTLAEVPDRETDFQNLQKPLENRVASQCTTRFTSHFRQQLFPKARMAEREGFEPTLPFE